MKPKKIIRYRVSISRTFPQTHPRKGEETYFIEEVLRNKNVKSSISGNASVDIGLDYGLFLECEPKIHTIRGNYAMWENRFEKINKGEAVLELYCWSGKPYSSPTVTICQLGRDDGIGVQKIEFDDYLYSALIEGKRFGDIHKLAKNDGLIFADFEAWFKGADLSRPMAIIHFTEFRY